MPSSRTPWFLALTATLALGACDAVSGFNDLVFDIPPTTSTGGGGSGTGGGGGGTCTSNEDCESNFCADGFCCDNACEGPCVACNLDGLEGVCSPHPAAEKPEPACEGVCDGAGQCAVGDVMWSRQIGDVEIEYVTAMAIDADDNTVLIGEFSGDVDFGDQTYTNINEDPFVLKLDPAGDTIWSLHIPNQGNGIEARGVAVDNGGNIIVVGGWEGNMTIDGMVYTDSGVGDDIFVVKLTPDGTVSWVNTYGNFGFDRATTVVTDDDDNIIFGGSFGSNLDFGAGPLPRIGGTDAFVAKLDPMGNHLWSRAAGSNGTDWVAGAAAAGDSDDAIIHFCGYFSGTIDFGGDPLMGTDQDDGFITQLDELGAEAWNLAVVGDGDQYARALSPWAGGVVIGGDVENQGMIATTSMTSAGDTDAFVGRILDTGEVAWARRHGSAGEDRTLDVTTDAGGNIIFTGYFNDSIELGGPDLSGAGGADVFLAKLSTDGEHLWSQRFGFAGTQRGNAVVADSKGAIVVAGRFDDSIRLGDDQYASFGNSDIFVVKLNP